MNINAYIGRIATEIELKKTSSGKLVVSFDLAVKRPYTKDTTDFIRCVAWERNAEFISRYFVKGQMISVSGYLTARKYEDKNGVKRTAYEVICERCSFCGDKPAAAADPAPGYTPYGSADADFGEIPNDEDLPF